MFAANQPNGSFYNYREPRHYNEICEKVTLLIDENRTHDSESSRQGALALRHKRTLKVEVNLDSITNHKPRGPLSQRAKYSADMVKIESQQLNENNEISKIREISESSINCTPSSLGPSSY